MAPSSAQRRTTQQATALGQSALRLRRLTAAWSTRPAPAPAAQLPLRRSGWGRSAAAATPRQSAPPESLAACAVRAARAPAPAHSYPAPACGHAMSGKGLRRGGVRRGAPALRACRVGGSARKPAASFQHRHRHALVRPQLEPRRLQDEAELRRLLPHLNAGVRVLQRLVQVYALLLLAARLRTAPAPSTPRQPSVLRQQPREHAYLQAES